MLRERQFSERLCPLLRVTSERECGACECGRERERWMERERERERERGMDGERENNRMTYICIRERKEEMDRERV